MRGWYRRHDFRCLRLFKAAKPDIRIVLADCLDSAMYPYVSSGEVVVSEGSTITEGIGNARVTDKMAQARADWALQVPDQDMVDMVYRLLREEGWFFGSSTAVNVCGAVEVARRLGPGYRIVTILCDDGGKYRSTLFNREWLAQKDLRARI